MGNPLFIEIQDKNEVPVLGIYFHWSGTPVGDAMNYARIVKALKDCKGDETDEELIRLLVKEFPDMGLATHPDWFPEDADTEIKYVEGLIAKGLPEGLNRNEGIIGVTNHVMNDMQSMADMYDVYQIGYPMLCIEHFADIHGADEDEIKEAQLLDNLVFDEFPIEMVDEFIKEVEKFPEGTYLWDDDEDMVFQWYS